MQANDNGDILKTFRTVNTFFEYDTKQKDMAKYKQVITEYMRTNRAILPQMVLDVTTPNSADWAVTTSYKLRLNINALLNGLKTEQSNAIVQKQAETKN